jgi:hypothetical protein
MGLGSEIRDPEKTYSGSPDPGVKKAPDPGSGSATLPQRLLKSQILADNSVAMHLGAPRSQPLEAKLITILLCVQGRPDLTLEADTPEKMFNVSFKSLNFIANKYLAYFLILVSFLQYCTILYNVTYRFLSAGWYI